MPFGDKLIYNIFDDGSIGLKNVTFDETYGLFQGYYYNGMYQTNTTRVCTKIINAVVKDVTVVLDSANYEIRGIGKFTKNYSYIEYISTLADRHKVTLEKGYYYNVVFSKLNTIADITPDEIAPYVYIGDKITLL